MTGSTAAWSAGGPATLSPVELLANFSAEITAKDADTFPHAAPLLPAGTPISVTYLPGETPEARGAAAALVRRLGHVPIPHVSARRLTSAMELDKFLEILASGALDRVFVVAGDCDPKGPFEDALAVIRSGRLAAHGVKRVGISGYPEGHPQIATEALWRAMREKHDALRDQGHEVIITTQFAFDVSAVVAWMREVRRRGFTSTIRLGVPGPANVKSLLRFAARCGVGTSSRVLRKYGASITQLMTVARPDRMLTDLAAALDPAIFGDVKIHLYPFGGLLRTAEWARAFQAGRTGLSPAAD